MFSRYINYDDDGKISSIREEEFDHGHSEGGIFRRDESNFYEHLVDYVTDQSLFNVKELIETANRDPELRKILGSILLNIMDEAKPIIEEARERREACKSKAKEFRESQRVDLRPVKKTGMQRRTSGKVKHSFYR